MNTSKKIDVPDTLGWRLDGAARRFAGRHTVSFSWTAPFGVLLDNLGDLPAPDGPRFHRREATPERLVAPQGSAGRALPADVTVRPRPIVGDGVDAVRVHDGDAADTLGWRLDGAARRFAGRHAIGSSWTAPLGVVLDHLGELPAPDGPRFHRREATPERLVAPQGSAERLVAPQGSAGRALPADVTARLRPIVGDGVDAVRVHDDDAADTRARTHRADAVSVGNDVYFRAGKLRPRDPHGFALLAHEATHVVERMRPGASWRRSTTGGAAEEERLALAHEARALVPSPMRHPATASGTADPITTVHTEHSGYPTTGLAASAAPAPVATPVGHTVARPMTAAGDRTVPPPADTTLGAGVDLEALKAALLRDLIGQLRDEFERGG